MPAAKLPFQESVPDNLKGLIGKTALTGGPTNSSLSMTQTPVRQINQYQRLMETYGVHVELQGENFMGVCPFMNCMEYRDKEPKLSMNIQTAQYQCFRCHAKGNSYGFIRAIHDHYLATTTEEDYQLLIKTRKNAFDLAICQEMQLAFNTATQEWMLPSWGRDGLDRGIINLYYWHKFKNDRGESIRQIYSGPTFKHVPYGVHRLREGTQRPIWVLEGHWDYLSFISLLSATKQIAKYDAIAVPGSGSFPRSYLSLFNGRSVIIAFDNDEAGETGSRNLIQAMHTHGVIPTALSVLKWPEGMASGFDVSDVITSLPAKYIKKVRNA